MPIIFIEQVNTDTFIGLWKIEESHSDLVQQLQLKNHELDLLKSLQSEKRSLHWLATRVLLRKMLNTESYIDCRADESGKPYLTNLPYQISLSHSYDFAAVMISKTSRVGIDIEIIKTKIDRVKNKFLNDDELLFIDPNQNLEHLYACWCAKEAIYKLNGKKETSFKDSIALEPFSYEAKGSIKGHIFKANQKENFIVYYNKYENYMLGYVVEGE